jgi:polyhydroxyalkanoate synthase
LETVFNPLYIKPDFFYENYRILSKKAFLDYLSQIERLLFGNTLEVGQTRSEVISEMGKVKVIHYAPFKKRTSLIPLLIITPLLSKPYILDLHPGLSFIEHLVKEGFDVYLIDFGVPDENDGSLGFEDYIFGYIPSAVEGVLRVASSNSLSLLGYCLGGVFTLLYVTLSDNKPVKNIVLVATPVDFSRLGLHYHFWKNVDADRLVNLFGNIPPELIIASFNLIAGIRNPLRYLKKHMDLFKNIPNREYVKKVLLINRWLAESPPFPAKAFKQLIKEFFRKNALIKMNLRIGGKVADLSKIECPILILSHKADVVSPPESAKALLDVVSTQDKEFIEVSGGDTGHIDIIIGDEGPKLTWPTIVSWLKPRSNRQAVKYYFTSR